jgi:hypothetical protein
MAKGCCNRNPIFVQNVLRTNVNNHIPSPPYAVFSSNGKTVLNNISGLSYTEGDGPSADSIIFDLLAGGLLPAADDITVTPNASFSNYFEFFNPDTAAWEDALATFSYLGGVKNLSGFKVRLKSGLVNDNYSGTLTVTAPNTTPFVLSASGLVMEASFILATGGIETIDGDYKVHTFTGDGIFRVTHLGSIGYDKVEYLVVAGGGGGGGGNGFCGGGGGGAGGFRTLPNHAIIIQSYPITIGAGGAKSLDFLNDATKGSDSIFDTITSIGGGFGATQKSNDGPGGNGGSGGGGSFVGVGGLGTLGQGDDGGNGSVGCGGGGGGGSAAIGSSAISSSGGNGGNGSASSITGVAINYSGGGGGGASVLSGGGAAGNGGAGGGGNGSDIGDGYNAVANKGGGGGGGYSFSGAYDFSGGNGSSGIVIIRYKFQ